MAAAEKADIKLAARAHNAKLAQGMRRAYMLEPKLAAILLPILNRAANDAASNFEAMVTHMTASAETDRELQSATSELDAARLEVQLARVEGDPKKLAEASRHLQSAQKKLSDAGRKARHEKKKPKPPVASKEPAQDVSLPEKKLQPTAESLPPGEVAKKLTEEAAKERDAFIETPSPGGTIEKIETSEVKKIAERLGQILTMPLGGPADWAKPAAEEIVGLAALVAELHTKTDPVREAVVQTMMRDTVGGAGLSFDITNPFAARVLAQSASQITDIAETTQAQAMGMIGLAHEEGLSIPDTAKMIRAVMKDSSQARATLIARTELAGAVNGGSLAATQIVQDATGVTYLKQWLTAPGAKYPRHEDYDGLDEQTQQLDQAFDVGGTALEFPGDPSGPPDEVCNCRCALVYIDAESAADEGVDVGGTSEAAERQTENEREVERALPSQLHEIGDDEEADFVTSDPAAAARALAAGQRVVLQQATEISTLIDDLGKIAADAKAAGETAPKLDLGRVTVPGTNLFAQESLGIPRIEMPQLGGVPLPGSKAEQLVRDGVLSTTAKGEVDLAPLFFERYREQGVKVSEPKLVRVDHLRATQSELDGAKVAGIMDYLEGGGKIERAVPVTSDGYIIDGHHQWAATVGLDYMKTSDKPWTIKASVVDRDVISVLNDANQFADEYGVGTQSAFKGVEAARAETTIGITPFTMEDTALGFYDTEKAKQFEAELAPVAKEYGVTITSSERVDGVWEGYSEPSYSVRAHDGPDGVMRFAEQMRAKYDQDGVILFTPSPEGTQYAFRIERVADTKAAIDKLAEFGISGATAGENTITVIAERAMGENVTKYADSIGGFVVRQRGDMSFASRLERDEAIKLYQGDGYYDVNKALRTGEGLLNQMGANEAAVVRDVARQIDRAMVESPTQSEITLYRGQGDTLSYWGAKPKDLVGRTIVEPSFLSMTADGAKATEFSARRTSGDRSGIVIKLTVPKGVGALNFDPMGLAESEVLLDRNLSIHFDKYSPRGGAGGGTLTGHVIPRPIEERPMLLPSDIRPVKGDDPYLAGLRKESKSITAKVWRLNKKLDANEVEFDALGREPRSQAVQDRHVKDRQKLLKERDALIGRRDDINAYLRSPGGPVAELSEIRAEILRLEALVDMFGEGKGAYERERLKLLDAREKTLTKLARMPITKDAPEPVAVAAEIQVKGKGPIIEGSTMQLDESVRLSELLRDKADNEWELLPPTKVNWGDPGQDPIEMEIGQSAVWKKDGVVFRKELPPVTGEYWDGAAAVRATQKITDNFLGDVPPEMKAHVNEVNIWNGFNPSDDYWRSVYPNFTASAAASGYGGMNFWAGGAQLDKDTFNHELGHLVGVKGGPPNTEVWAAAAEADLEYQQRQFAGDLLEIGVPDGSAGYVYEDSGIQNALVGAPFISAYGASSIVEDWADAINYYMRDLRTGRIGTFNDKPVRFGDLWPNREAQINAYLTLPPLPPSVTPTEGMFPSVMSTRAALHAPDPFAETARVEIPYTSHDKIRHEPVGTQEWKRQEIEAQAMLTEGLEGYGYGAIDDFGRPEAASILNDNGARAAAKRGVQASLAARLEKDPTWAAAAKQPEFKAMDELRVGDTFRFEENAEVFRVTSIEPVAGERPLDKNAWPPVADYKLNAEVVSPGQRLGTFDSGRTWTIYAGEGETVERMKQARVFNGEVHPLPSHDYTRMDEDSHLIDYKPGRLKPTYDEQVTAALVDNWTFTSGDASPWSIALQQATADEFHMGAAPMFVFGNRAAESQEFAKQIYAEKGPALRAFVRAQYDETQRLLREHGITEVTLYRGMGEQQREGYFTSGQEQIRLQPASSFSADYRVAQSFTRDNPLVIAVKVPAERILSTPRSGWGALSESEFVVLAPAEGAVTDGAIVMRRDNIGGFPSTPTEFWATVKADAATGELERSYQKAMLEQWEISGPAPLIALDNNQRFIVADGQNVNPNLVMKKVGVEHDALGNSHVVAEVVVGPDAGRRFELGTTTIVRPAKAKA